MAAASHLRVPYVLAVLGIACGCMGAAPPDDEESVSASTQALSAAVSNAQRNLIGEALAALGSGPAFEVCRGLATDASAAPPARIAGKTALTLALAASPDTCEGSTRKSALNHAAAADFAIPTGVSRLNFVAPPGLDQLPVECLIFAWSKDAAETAFVANRHTGQQGGGGTYLDVPPSASRAGVLCTSRAPSGMVSPRTLPFTITWSPSGTK